MTTLTTRKSRSAKKVTFRRSERNQQEFSTPGAEYVPSVRLREVASDAMIRTTRNQHSSAARTNLVAKEAEKDGQKQMIWACARG